MLEEGRALLTQAVLEGVRVVILRAEPVKGIWSSGHDIAEIPREAQEHVWTNPLEGFLEYFRRLPLATIAEVGGNVWGGAVELVLSCDMVVARADATMAITPARLGVGYSVSGVARLLACLPAHVVSRMFLTAEPITMSYAHGLGAISEIVETDEELVAASQLLADKVVPNAPLTIAAAKAAIAELADSHLPQSAAQRADAAVTRAWVSRDLAEGISAFEQRRKPDFQGH